MEIRTRFAPSPTGDLHLGGARTALFNYLFAKSMNGKFLLRIEDTDLKRSDDSLSQKILNDLKWLKIPWDEQVIYQSNNHNQHRQIIDLLVDKGLAFRCFTRKEDLTKSNKDYNEKKDPIFRSPWRDSSIKELSSEEYVIRFKIPNDPSRVFFNDKIRGELSWNLNSIEDFVIARSDNTPTYNLAVVVDDHEMNISHVIRGEDHLTNTVKQLLIYQALNWNPPVFAHIPLIHNSVGEKLSKRDGKSNLLDFKQEGYLPDAMTNYIAKLGWSYRDEEIFNLKQAISWFTLEGIGKSPSKFDMKKLSFVSKKYLMLKPVNELYDSFLEYIKLYKNIDLSEISLKWLRQFLPLVNGRCSSLGEIFDSSSFIFEHAEVRHKKSLALLDNVSKTIIRDFTTSINSTNLTWEAKHLEEFINTYCELNKLKFHDIGVPLRIGITGSRSSPSIVQIMEILGKDEILNRLKTTAVESKN